MSDPYENFKEAKLKNGVTVFFSEIPQPWIKTSVIVHAGAKDDLEGREGTAHFLEHLLSHNVEGITRRDAEEYFEEVGGSAYFGSTGYEETSYSFAVPLENDNLKYALNFYGAMLFESTLEHSIERERQIIIGEYKERFPIPLSEEIIIKRRSVLFGEHKLSKFLSPLGSLSTIHAISKEDVVEYYSRCYVPKNVSIIASGGITLTEFLKMLEGSKLSLVKAGERVPIPRALSYLPVVGETLWHKSYAEAFHKKPQQASILICLSLPGSITNSVIGRALNALGETLFREIREERGWTYGINFHHFDFPEAHDIYIDVDYPWDHESEIVAVIDDCVERAIGDVKMIERHIRRSINRFKIHDTTVSEVLGSVQDDVIKYGFVRTYADVLCEREAVKVEDVQNILKMFRKETRFIIELGS